MSLQGNPLDYLIAFFAGCLVSFTPCIYPLLGVSISFIGIEPSTKKSAGFILSLIYVSGIALVYAGLGLIAAVSGSIFGIISVHPFTRIGAGIIFIFFGLSLWGVFRFKGVDARPRFLLGMKGKARVFALGLSSGLVIGPCVSPVLGSILVLAASGRNLFYAATLLLSFGYGMGLLLILAGTFSRLLLALPKAGSWMSRVKFLSGLALIGVGAYFIFLAITGG